MLNIVKKISVDSTNLYLRNLLNEGELPHGYCVCTEFQRDGRGQQGTIWESMARRNLLFSFVLNTEKIPIFQQFLVSEIVSIGICNVLKMRGINTEIKWPNDIFYNGKKLAGILIETIIAGDKMKYAIVGVGLNVNQRTFSRDLPNAVSMIRIVGRKLDRQELLEEILTEILSLFDNFEPQNSDDLQKRYFELLYRNSGFHIFEDETERFYAKIISVAPDGCIKLLTTNDIEKNYYFKEVKFIL